MTRLQQEIARRLPTIGCASEFDSESGILNITLNNEHICNLQPKGFNSYRSDEHNTDEKKECLQKIEDMTEQTKKYIELYESAPQFEIEGISDYRKLAEFGDVVFGAKDMGDSGFQFSSWFKTYGGIGATMGDYSFDYEYSMRSFAERSGLVDKNRQFTTEQLEDIHRCIAFTRAVNDNLTYEQDKSLENIIEKIESALPYISDDPEYYEFQSEEEMTMQ